MRDSQFNDALVRALSDYRAMLKRERSQDLFELPFPGRPGIIPHEIAERFPDLDAAFGATVSMSLQSQFSARVHQLSAAIKLCESPIEARFLLSLVCACAMNDLSVSILEEEMNTLFSTDGCENDTVLFVMPQAEIAGHRVDFALELHFADPFHRMAAMFGKPKPQNTPETVVERLIIECDGHEFHEKTAQQAKRDKSRDRDLLAEGYPVMRFTGSEIFRSPLECSIQVVCDFFKINK